MRRALGMLGVIGLATAVALAASASATAAPGQRAGKYATITAAPAALSLVAGFPSATFTTTASGIGTPVSATIGAATPPGLVYGTSSGSSYLSFGPTSQTVPSVTTFTFASPTPTTGWSFILGDVDAETITIDATGPGGPITGADLGFQGGFNYAAGGSEITTFDATTRILSGRPDGQDTNGAAGWFSPTVPITSLTLTSTRVTGVPLAQFWVVGHTASLAGYVTDAAGAPVAGATVTVNEATGPPLPGGSATAVTDATGAFDIPEVFPQSVTVIATAADREPGAPLTVTPAPDADGRPVFPTAAAVTAGALFPVIVPPAPPAPAAVDPALAETGPDAATPAGLAAIALLAGGILLAADRRRRTTGRPSLR